MPEAARLKPVIGAQWRAQHRLIAASVETQTRAIRKTQIDFLNESIPRSLVAVVASEHSSTKGYSCSRFIEKQ